MTERYKICKGKPLKIANLKIVSNELTSKNYWTFSVPMNNKNGAFEFVRIKVLGRCPYKQGDKVRVCDITSYHSMIGYGMTGGRVVMRTLECVVEPYKRMADEVEEEDDDYE